MTVSTIICLKYLLSSLDLPVDISFIDHDLPPLSILPATQHLNTPSTSFAAVCAVSCLLLPSEYENLHRQRILEGFQLACFSLSQHSIKKKKRKKHVEIKSFCKVNYVCLDFRLLGLLYTAHRMPSLLVQNQTSMNQLTNKDI